VIVLEHQSVPRRRSEMHNFAYFKCGSFKCRKPTRQLDIYANRFTGEIKSTTASDSEGVPAPVKRSMLVGSTIRIHKTVPEFEDTSMNVDSQIESEINRQREERDFQNAPSPERSDDSSETVIVKPALKQSRNHADKRIERYVSFL
jgi:hypothetical protein